MFIVLHQTIDKRIVFIFIILFYLIIGIFKMANMFQVINWFEINDVNKLLSFLN